MYLPVDGRNEKIYIYTHVFGYFSNSMYEKKKICIYVFLGIFQNNSGKKKEKKIFGAGTDLGYCLIVL